MDTFQRYIGYDHATGKLTCEPSFTKVFPWMPQEGPKWDWRRFGHLSLFLDKLDELRGYDLLDVFFPNYGDAYTAHITRLLTGTPYGPVDFVLLDRATAEHLSTFGVLAVLGKATVRQETEAKLSEAARSGAQVIVAAQHFPDLARERGRQALRPYLSQRQHGSAGPGHGHAGDLCRQDRELSGRRVQRQGDGWETVASVGNRPLIAAQAAGQGNGLRVPGPLGVARGRCPAQRAGLCGPAGCPAGIRQARRSTGICRLPEEPWGLGGVVQPWEHRDRLRSSGPRQVARAHRRSRCSPRPAVLTAARSSSAWTAWGSTRPGITPSTRCWGSTARRWTVWSPAARRSK